MDFFRAADYNGLGTKTRGRLKFMNALFNSLEKMIIENIDRILRTRYDDSEFEGTEPRRE